MSDRRAVRSTALHRSALGVFVALICLCAGLLNPAKADDLDIYTNQNLLPAQAPLTVLVLDLNLLNLNSLVCSNVLLSNESDCIALRKLLTFQQLFNILGVPFPLLVGLDPLGLLGDLPNTTLSILDNTPPLLSALLGNVVGVLIGTVTATVGSVLGPLNPLNLANNPALGLFMALNSVLEPLINTRVAVMLFHGDRGVAAGSRCAFADQSSLGGLRQQTVGCSNGAYVFLGLINLTSPVDLLSKLVPQVLNVVGSLVVGGALSPQAVANLASASPYQTKEAYAELMKYLRGDRVYNAHLDANDGLLTKTLTWDRGIETSDGLSYRGALRDFPQACTINMLHVQLTEASGQDDSDNDLQLLLPNADANRDGRWSMVEVVDSASNDGFAYGSSGDRRKINSYFLVQDSIGNLADLSALSRLGYNVTTYTNLLGLLGRGRDISGTVVNRNLSVDASLLSPSISASRSSANGIGDGAYVAQFRPDPDQKPAWAGNLKRLRLKSDAQGKLQYYDVGNQLAFASDGRIHTGALTYWTDPTKLGGRSFDGRATTLGGAGQKIPGYQFNGGGAPGRSNPATPGAASARQLFYDAYPAGSSPVLAALNPDDAGVRTELLGATQAVAYSSPTGSCQTLCNSNASVCAGTCSSSQTSCNNGCTSSQSSCDLGCSASQSSCNNSAAASQSSCISSADSAQALCQLTNNLSTCQLTAATALSACNLPVETAFALCSTTAAAVRDTCTLPASTALALCQTNAGLTRTLCNAACLLGGSACIAACTTAYNNSLATCTTNFNNATAPCNASFNGSISSCNTTRSNGLATCTSNYNNSLANCTAAFNNCATVRNAAVAQCNSNFTSASALCTSNFNSCSTGCSGNASACSSSCSSSRNACDASCSSSENSCLLGCGNSSSRSADTVTRELLLYARGYEVGTQASPKGTGPSSSPTNTGISGRPWLMGAVLHSRPLAINYGKRGGAGADDIRVVFGSADGFLRMVRDDSGVESWGFMPQAVMSNLKVLRENQAGAALPYGVDGSPVSLIRDRAPSSGSDAGKLGTIGDSSEDRVLLFFGLRRGGSHYYALDVTDPDSPKLRWRIGPDGLYQAGSSAVVAGSAAQFAELGLSFSTPQVGSLRVDADGNSATRNDISSKSVLIFGGGYNGGRNSAGARIGKDLNNSRNAVVADQVGRDDGSTSSARGNGLYIVDAETGALIWRGVRANAVGYAAASLSYGNPLLVDSIPSEVTALDTDNDGLTDRLYVGDTGGRLWRADFPGADRSAWTLTPLASVGRHAESNPALASDRRMFHAPDYVPIRQRDIAYDVILFGTGDREDPLNITTRNWVYAYRDTDVVSGKTSAEIISTEAGLASARHSAFVDRTSACAAAAGGSCEDISGLNPGYRIALGGSGEKLFSAPLSLGGASSFTTYLPPSPTAATCVPLEGSGLLYNIGLRSSRPQPYVGQIGADRSTPLPSPGLPGEVNAITGNNQGASSTLIQQTTRTKWRASWRERLGEDEKALP